MYLTLPTVLALLASLNFGLPQSVDATPSARPASVVHMFQGRVVTPSGAPIAFARVSVYVDGNPEAILTARTEADGSYKLSLPAGEAGYTLRVHAIGYMPASMPLGQVGVPGTVVMQPITVPMPSEED